MQSTPINGFYSSICIFFILLRYSIGLNPEFSARVIGISSNASAKALTAYYSIPSILSAYWDTSIAHASSVAPPPPTTLLFFTMFLTTHIASNKHLFASSQIVLDPPLIKTVTAFEFSHSYIKRTFSFEVPKENSLITPHFPSFSGEIS